MATHGLSEAEFEECEDTFKFLDTNSDERVELRELCSGLSELGLCLTNSEIKAFLDHFGKDSHEYLIFDEYVDFFKECMMSKPITKEEAIKLFRQTDVNKDGLLGIFELKSLMIEKGVLLGESEITSLLRDYDYNSDSKLSLNEFLDSVFK